MRSPRLNPFLAAMFIATIFNLSAATVTWDGGGGNFSWQTPANWSGDVLPNTLDDVVINVGGGITVTSTANVTIRSLQCSNHLALTAGTFRVTTNASVVQGQLFVIGNPVLSASGPTTTFALPAATNIDGVGLEALSNATLTASQVIGYSRGAGCFTTFWQATGGNGQINLPALASLTGPGCASHNLQVSSGGKILLPALTNLADGTLSFLADGVNALIDLPLLATSDGTRAISLEAKNGGTIWSPLFVGGKTVTPVLRPLSTLPMAQFTSLAGFTVAGTNVNFPLLTNLYNGSINVSSNAVTMTNLFAHDTPSCAVHTRQVSDGQRVERPAPRSMSGPCCGALEIRAFSGALDFSADQWWKALLTSAPRGRTVSWIYPR
ncbi:MAG: hypothetical protein U1F65_07225 [Verrucomicrobiota bacterium]